MRALGENGFPVPQAVDQNRHVVLMTRAPGKLLEHRRQDIRNPARVYNQMIDLMERLARLGLIHCDFNEFNAMVDDKDRVTMIDFPQMISTGK